ncbi:nuclear transport factor 2 family protein [Flavobacterium sp. NRK F7]|uniref:nuclear transport factor 2 family protein n=1 Tax=Flavobacterium sp. NRK F7 TaxID=2954930 RepID=UPI002091192C|nr:nuclear transport factor 2 family protein [Flavobacterium sp. NRK F7]MCO6161233.1 nuclear transport factor 2 family protein [Flavobacterium sp. NRK F7]
MKKILLLLCFTSFVVAQHQEKEKATIHALLDAWHQAAAKAQFDAYFNAMADESIFIGTDATENWDKKEFIAFAKPYFDKGKAWSFTPLERHIFVSKDGKTAWFDELLNTQMKICRGSGVLVKEGKAWKIKHYVLSMTVPNDQVDAAIKIKAPIEDALIDGYTK